MRRIVIILSLAILAVGCRVSTQLGYRGNLLSLYYKEPLSMPHAGSRETKRHEQVEQPSEQPSQPEPKPYDNREMTKEELDEYYKTEEEKEHEFRKWYEKQHAQEIEDRKLLAKKLGFNDDPDAILSSLSTDWHFFISSVNREWYQFHYSSKCFNGLKLILSLIPPHSNDAYIYPGAPSIDVEDRYGRKGQLLVVQIFVHHEDGSILAHYQRKQFGSYWLIP